VQALLDFAQGPLFRLTFVIMVAGLTRIIILSIWNAVDAYLNAGDKQLAWGKAVKTTISWLVPVNHVFRARPLYSVISILFHIGLIIVPILLLAHVQLWKASTGVYWVTLPKAWADFLTLTTVGAGLTLFLGRVSSRNARFLSRAQDYIWPLILIVPFATGYICSNTAVQPMTYYILMLIHVLSAELILVLIPFTKIAHCVVLPISQFVLTLAWKFPARVDEKICVALGKKGSKI